MDPAFWRQDSFQRLPEWRLRRAEFLLATGGRRDPRIDDDWVASAHTALQGGGGRGSRAVAVRAAQHVWVGDGSMRWELEARLLAAESADAIAGRLALPASVIRGYKMIFFDVGDRLNARDWVLARAIRFIPPSMGAVWKYSGFFGGSVLLDAVIAATADRPLPPDFTSAIGPRRVAEEVLFRLRTRLWVASLIVTSDVEFAQVVKAQQHLRALDARLNDRDENVATPVVVEMERFLKKLPAMRARAGRNGGSGSRSSPFGEWNHGMGRAVEAEDESIDLRQMLEEIDSAARIVEITLVPTANRSANGREAESNEHAAAANRPPHRVA